MGAVMSTDDLHLLDDLKAVKWFEHNYLICRQAAARIVALTAERDEARLFESARDRALLALEEMKRERDEACGRLAAEVRKVAALQKDPLFRLKEGMRERAEDAERERDALKRALKDLATSGIEAIRSGAGTDERMNFAAECRVALATLTTEPRS